MKRRDFLGILGSGAFALPAAAAKTPRSPADWTHIIDTPEQRAIYAKRLLNELCTDLGPRPSGSKSSEYGIRIIEREMKHSLPRVELDRFTFTNWELTGKPEFRIGDRALETAPYWGAPSTPPEGVRGILKKENNRFSVVDETSGKTLAGISVSEYGRAIPAHQDGQAPGAVPIFGIGRQDTPLLDRAAEAGTPVTAKVKSRFIPNTSSANVIGRLPGKTKDEILIVAHSDTVYCAPGANDNTASVIVMLMLAHAAAVMKPDLTLTFGAMEGEEIGYLGANHYGKRREADGTMKNIRYTVNFDSLTYGPNIQVHSESPELRKIMSAIHADLKINATPRLFEDSGYTMDSSPFKPSRGRAVYLNSRGYDERTLPVYHRPEDTPESVPLDCMEISFLVMREFIRRLGRKA